MERFVATQGAGRIGSNRIYVTLPKWRGEPPRAGSFSSPTASLLTTFHPLPVRAAGQLSNELDRLALTKNLFEEMGLGDMGNEPHVKIYRDMLFALDLDPEMSPAFPETIALVSTMLRLCSAPNPIVGLGALCLGAEAIVPHVYAQILNGLVARGFPMQQLRFFPLHIDGDDDHALTMKGIIDRELSENPEQSVILAATAEDCIVQRARFFEAISSRALLGQGESAYAI
jgi:pyrroloquinoline-quinone synthase